MPAEPHGTAAALRGMRDASLGRVVGQVLQFGFTIALVRLLEPRDFGVVALCGVVTGFLLLLADLGTGAAIIQRRELNQRLLTSAWVLNVGIGVGAATLLMLGSTSLAILLGNPNAAPIIRGLALVFPVRSVALVHEALLQRELHFDTVARAEVFGTLGGGAAAVAAALSGWGAWSLVAQMVVVSAVGGAVMILGERWIPTERPSAAELRSIASFSVNLSGYNTVNYFARNADNFLIGRFLGASSLGLYAIGYTTILYPLRNVSNVITNVAYPVLSRRQDDDSSLLRVYLRVVRSVAFVTFPMMTILGFLSPVFVAALYGPKWTGVAPILVVLAPIGMLQSVTSTLISVYQAKARTDLLFRVGAVQSAVVVSGFVVGLRWGVLGVAVSYLVTNLLLLYPIVHVPMALVQGHASDFFGAAWKPAALALLAGVCSYAASTWGPFAAAVPVVRLIVPAAIGVAVYVAASALLLKEDVEWMVLRFREALARQA